MQWIVAKNEEQMRLLDFVVQKMGPVSSKRKLKEAINGNLCSLNGQVERFASTRLSSGDVVVFTPMEKRSYPEDIKVPVIYEDADFICVDKPAGMVSEEEGLLGVLQKGLSLVHRLDKDTSGVILLAKNLQTQRSFEELFRTRKIKKSYIAVVDGCIKEDKGTIEKYLGKIGAYEGQVLWGEVPSGRGKYSHTDWQCIKRAPTYSVLRCFPTTGRTHQIRVHLKLLGHPILGDYQYCRSFQHADSFPRHLLHAESIAFPHPSTQLPMYFKAPLPKIFDFTAEL